MTWLIGRAAVAPAALLAAALAAATMTPAFAQPTVLDPSVQTAPHDEALRLLGEALGQSVEATQTDPTIPEILAALEDNIAATRRIRDLAESETELTDEQMQQIGTEIGGIARSFEEIASYAPGVFERRWQELSTLDAIGNAIGFRIADARSRLEFLRADNTRIQQEMVNATLTQAQIEKDRITQQANNAEMASLDAALQAWGFFSERHGELMTRMGDQSEDLDVFFHALRENARVYNAAAQTLSLANSLRGALSDLESVESLNSMRGELVDSWGDLMRIVDQVNNGLILQPGM